MVCELGKIVRFHGRKGCDRKDIPKFLFIDLDFEVILFCTSGGMCVFRSETCFPFLLASLFFLLSLLTYLVIVFHV